VRPDLLKVSYWIATVAAVVLTASVWFRLAVPSGPSARTESDLTTIVPEDILASRVFQASAAA